MKRNQEIQLFDNLFRQRPLRDWLDEQLQVQVAILMAHPQHEAILKAQGAAAFIKQFQDRLNAAEEAGSKSANWQ